MPNVKELRSSTDLLLAMESTQYRMPESVDKQAREIAIKNRVNKRLRNEKRYEAIKQTFEQIEIAKDVELMPL